MLSISAEDTDQVGVLGPMSEVSDLRGSFLPSYLEVLGKRPGSCRGKGKRTYNAQVVSELPNCQLLLSARLWLWRRW